MYIILLLHNDSRKNMLTLFKQNEKKNIKRYVIIILYNYIVTICILQIK